MEVGCFFFITDNAYTPQNILDNEVGCFITDNAYTPQNTRHKGRLFFYHKQRIQTPKHTRQQASCGIVVTTFLRVIGVLNEPLEIQRCHSTTVGGGGGQPPQLWWIQKLAIGGSILGRGQGGLRRLN